MEKMSKENGGQVISPSYINFPFLCHHNLSDDHHSFCFPFYHLHHNIFDDHQGGLITNTASAAGIIFGDQDPALVDFFFFSFYQQ